MSGRRRRRRKPSERYCVVLPPRLVDELDALVTEGYGSSRSDLLRRGARLLLEQIEHVERPEA